MNKPKKNKVAVIIAGGEIRDYRYSKAIVSKADYVICADSGLNHAKKMKISPDVIVGDFDSICLHNVGKNYKKTKIKKYPKEKNNSDTELAIRYALKQGCEKVIILGALGKRIDHSMANIFSAGLFAGKVILIDEFTELKVVEKKFSLEGEKGETVSLLPYFSRVRGLRGSGFKYSINGINLKANSRGLSNELIANKAQGKMESGKLLLIKVKKL